PGMMARLGKVGFSQSYTYFTWRNTKAELSEYFSELNEPPLRRGRHARPFGSRYVTWSGTGWSRA
ncbi:hypothetical protein, partial [Shigella sp. FC1056]|uniref:hypothetical protein n=1 Tax=Shigella sp. FC1056 TaxID=1892898 RepID=UPI001A7E8430